MKFTIFCLLILILSVSLNTNAQDGKNSRIKGEVSDIFGAFISNVKIKAEDSNGKIYQAKINEKGEYEIGLPQGSYNILFERPLFKTFEVKDFQSGNNLILQLDVCLVCEDCELIEDKVSPDTENFLWW